MPHINDTPIDCKGMVRIFSARFMDAIRSAISAAVEAFRDEYSRGEHCIISVKDSEKGNWLYLSYDSEAAEVERVARKGDASKIRNSEEMRRALRIYRQKIRDAGADSAEVDCRLQWGRD